MKILVSITAALLIAVSGTSGYYIWNLNEQITESTQQWEKSIQELIRDLNTTIDADDESFLGKIENVDRSLDDYSFSLQEEITETERQIADCAQETGDLKVKTTATEDFIGNHIVDTQSIFEKAREATVRISWKGYYLGSGFIVSFPYRGSYEEDFIVTNYYVVKIITYPHSPPYNAEDCTVMITLSDGRTVRGDLFAGSEESNIALLKLNPVKYTQPFSPRDFYPLPSLSLADSSNVAVGDSVFIVGCPDDGEESRVGLKESITSGIVSQIKRSGPVSGDFLANMIQVDAAINFGNGGSPLLNKDCEVIGLVTARINPLLGEGIGLVLPSNQIKEVGELLKDGYDSKQFGQPAHVYEYPDTGITVADLLPKDIVANGNTIHSGVKVTQVLTTADVRTDDIIIGIDDYPVQTSDDFYSCIVEHYTAGDEITLKIIRDGNEITSTLTVD